MVQRAVKQAASDVGVSRSVSCHTFRHSFATHLIEDGYDIRTIQALLGDKDVKKTMIYTHVLNRGGGRGVRSPADALFASVVAAPPRTRQLSPPSNSLPPDLPPTRQLIPAEGDTAISAEPYEDD